MVDRAPAPRPGALHPLILILTLLAAGIIASGIFFYRLQQSDVVAQANTQLASIADLKVSDLVSWRSERLGDATMIAHNPAFADLVARTLASPTRKVPADLDGWLERIVAAGPYDRVVLLDKDGRVLSSKPATDRAIAAQVVSAAPSAVAAKAVSFVDFYRDESTGIIHLGVLAPITDSGTGAPLGAVYLRVDPRVSLYPSLSKWPLPSETGETQLVRREGDSAVFLAPLRFKSDAALKMTARFGTSHPTSAAKAVQGFQGLYRGSDYRGEEVLSAVRHVPGSDWFLVAKTDTREALALLPSRNWQLLILITAVLAAIGVSVRYTQRKRDAHFYRDRLLAESERSWLLDVLAGSPSEIYVFEADTLRFTFANSSALAALGYTIDELRAMTPQDIQPSFDPDSMAALVIHEDSGRSDRLVVEATHHRKDGTEYPATVEFMRMRAGTREVMLAVADDVTVRDATIDELRASEERYRTLVEQASDGIFVSDGAGRYIDVNESGAEMLGYTHAEIVDRSISDILDPTDLRERPINLEELRQRKIVIMERNWLRKDGSRLPVEISARMTTDGRMQFIVRDVSERAIADARLRESEALLIESQRAAAVGHYVYDITGDKWTSWEVLDEILGIDADYERTNAGWAQILYPEDRDVMMDFLQPQTLSAQQIVDREYRIIRMNDHEVRWVRGLGRVEFDEQHTPVKMFGVIQDITERKLAEIEVQQFAATLEQTVQDRTAQLQAANRELEAFSYSVSHDLRAPLRHMSGFVELLAARDRDRLDEKGLHYLEVIADSVRQMGILIDNLLQFSRVGRAEMKLVDLDMDALMHEALDPIQEDCAGRTIDWTLGELPHVRGDTASLRLVWANLLGNAVKYTRTHPDAHIEVGCVDEPDDTEFFIRDDGVGFDMQYAGKLFGVFQRLHSAEEFEGTGIGLANVSRVVTRHGGNVWAEAAIDHGATFHFSLPKQRG